MYLIGALVFDLEIVILILFNAIFSATGKVSYLGSFRQEMTLSRCFILVSKWHLNFPKRQLPSPEKEFHQC